VKHALKSRLHALLLDEQVRIIVTNRSSFQSKWLLVAVCYLGTLESVSASGTMLMLANE
jgi:hypothetical protein